MDINIEKSNDKTSTISQTYAAVDKFYVTCNRSDDFFCHIFMLDKTC